MKRPTKPARCEAVHQWQGKRYRCGTLVRSLAAVASELQEFAVKWRAIGVQVWSEHASYESDGGAGMLAFAADVDLPALALELEGKLCQRCAEEESERRGLLLKLAFLGCLVGKSGRDERAEEEFELARCAA